MAWATNQLGQKSMVYMPKGSSEIRLNNIRKEGSEASITDLNYDDTIVEVPGTSTFLTLTHQTNNIKLFPNEINYDFEAPLFPSRLIE
ncbi:hypothetical protein [Schinkia azotoformans]|uniref:hypothetical protein n=1 Tax=Schinkia azotoformans TaxID=1454 RepID=UPI002DB99C1E|nr:hypothetical protein [Schinkia azotoformans]MEC1718587.1 hypothetical protein [Schinkia azotoformans]MEC1743630.1 hypothetical protein [Schinkia azotoformans]MEC1748212.1 hypothetical protein [Schinkia azotoformans]MEC1760690.1 hypothetical protein [Schinkia azotoformans]MEC1769510.1 hypothetical protein [Schinkia azotoformans]